MTLSKPTWIRLLILAGAAVLVGGGIAWYRYSAAPAASTLRTAVVKRADLVATVSATGTIEPEEVVDVGTQVVGMVQEFGRDPHDSSRAIDYLSVVDEGTVLARIDDAIYRARRDRTAAQVEQAQAVIAQAQADLRRAEANVQQVQAKYQQAVLDWERARKLLATRAVSQEEYDARQAAHAVAKADLAVAEAAAAQAQATTVATEKALLLAQADQREAQQNLDYTVIRSPVKGVIVDRRVNVGQTVVSSLNAPSLFLIAKDLKRLQVWASVNEADVGRVRKGQPVRFTVDAFPEEVFQGQVSQVRLNATMTQNVVTYTVAVDTDNSSGKLLPYLTANLQFEVGQRRNALLVPNAALRWQPRPEQIAPDVRQEFLQAGRDRAMTGATAPPPTVGKPAHPHGLVWVEDQGWLRPLEVDVGLSDGLQTEITGGELREGHRVVIGEELPAEAEGAASPFAPQIFGGGRR
jgi:HlyD family secretion protein